MVVKKFTSMSSGPSSPGGYSAMSWSMSSAGVCCGGSVEVGECWAYEVCLRLRTVVHLGGGVRAHGRGDVRIYGLRGHVVCRVL